MTVLVSMSNYHERSSERSSENKYSEQNHVFRSKNLTLCGGSVESKSILVQDSLDR